MEAQKRELVGLLVAGKYRIERLLGAGAMGEVYVAEQVSLGKRVAIKVLHRHLAGEPGIAKRFHREARAASILEHPNCIQVIDFGDDNELLYIAMELLSGRDLLKVIKTEGPLPTGRIVHLMSQVLGALDEAHHKGVVHRDLKPENVMVSDLRGQKDFVKVCDFGIAKLTSERDSQSAITVAGMVCGTPEYMSPEQARGDELDGRSDLYAAACILYQMAVGDVPFRAGSALGVVTKHLMERPEAPSKRRPDAVDPRLEALILKGLEKEREQRPATAAEMRAELEAISPVGTESSRAWRVADVALGMAATAEQIPATPTPVKAVEAAAPMATGSGVTGEVVAEAPRKRTALWAGLGAGIVLIGGGVAGVTIMKGQSSVSVGLRVDTDGKGKVEGIRLVQTPSAPEATPVPAAVPAAVPVPVPVPVPAIVAAQAPRSKHSSSSRPVKGAPSDALVASTAPAAAAPAAKSGYAAAYAEGQALFSAGETEKAAAKYEEAARLEPGRAVVHRELGKCYSRLRQKERAKKEYAKYLELAPDASDAAFYKSIVQ